MNPGDIYWVELPAVSGREQAGRRPAVILQNEDFASANPLVIVIPITSARAATRFAGTMVVEPTQSNGLSLTSVVLAFQIRAIDRRFLGDWIGHITSDQLGDLYTLLDQLTGRPDAI